MARHRKGARLVGRIGSGVQFSSIFQKNPRLVGWLGSIVQVSAIYKKIPRLVGRLGSRPRLAGRIGSGYGLVFFTLISSNLHFWGKFSHYDVFCDGGPESIALRALGTSRKG